MTTVGVDSGPDARGRVLIAEDEEHLGALLAQYLRGRGLDVTLVRDGAEAVAALQGAAFDAAVVDVQMPGADGFTVLAASSALTRPVEVVIASGNGTRETALAALRGGAYGTIAKPYRMAEVELVVQRAIEMRRLRDAVLRLERECAALRDRLGAATADGAEAAPGTIDARNEPA
ncbi:MAG TPA: response regulator [Gemmatirosa sp.]